MSYLLVVMDMTFQCSDLFHRLEIMITQVSYRCIHAERVYFQVFELVICVCDVSIEQMTPVDPTVLRDLQAHRSLE